MKSKKTRQSKAPIGTRKTKLGGELFAKNSQAALFALVFALVGIAVIVSSYAAPSGKGKNTGSSSISLVLLNSTDSLAHYGQQVTFNVSTTATDQPFVRLDCYENGVWALSSSAGFFDSYPWPWTRNFTLNWDRYHKAGASANCTATLYSQSSSRSTTLATTTFQVYP